MFDVGLSEMVVIAIVALIVIGPEKLPKVARTLGLLAGRMQRYVSNIKSDIEREMQFEDLQKLQQEIKQGLTQTQSQLHGAAGHVKKEVAALERDIESSLLPPQLAESVEFSDPDKLKLNHPGLENQALKSQAAANSVADSSTENLMQPMHNSRSTSQPQQETKPTKPQ